MLLRLVLFGLTVWVAAIHNMYCSLGNRSWKQCKAQNVPINFYTSRQRSLGDGFMITAINIILFHAIQNLLIKIKLINNKKIILIIAQFFYNGNEYWVK